MIKTRIKKAVSFVGLMMFVAIFMTPAQSAPQLLTESASQGILIAPEYEISNKELLNLTGHQCGRDCNRRCDRRCHRECNRYESRRHYRQCKRECNRPCERRCHRQCYR